MIAMTIVSLLLVAAMLYTSIASVRINRMHTLSKNFEWVAENRPFLEKYHQPVLWPLLLCASGVCGIIIAGAFKQSLDLVLWGKYYGILTAAGIVIVCYYSIEKRLSLNIPRRQERTATLVKRSVANYVHPVVVALSKGAAIFVVAAQLFSFLFHKIPTVVLLSDLLCSGISIILLFGGLYWSLIEKIPHGNDISTVTKINVGENYKKFSLNFLCATIIVMSLLLVFQLVLQWNGYDLAPSYQRGLFSKLFDAPAREFKPIFSLYQWDMIVSVAAIPLFVYIAHCKPFRDILAITIKPSAGGTAPSA